MSLIKQLWLAIALVMTISFGGSLVVSVLSARHYLEQQLQLKNIDNATALALSLTQMEKDPVTIELQVSAQFDAGHYQFIRVTSPTGETLVEKSYQGPAGEAPSWLPKLVPIRAEPGKAFIQDGWKPFGVVSLASHDQFVYKSLWDGMLDLMLWFLVGGVATGLVGNLAVRAITRPLGNVVGQAAAIAERRFLTVPEPRIPELRAVVRAMNTMVDRLKAMFSEEASRLEALRKKVNTDAVTGISNRDYFMSHLREVLSGESFGSTGSLALVRLPDLNVINAKLGRQRADAMLRDLAQVLYDSGNGRPGQRAGRVKGGEFAVLCPSFASPTEAAQDLVERLQRDWAPKWQSELEELFTLAAVRWERGQGLGDVLTRADQALAQAAAKGPNAWHSEEGSTNKISMPAEQWRTLLTQAVSGGQLSLAFYPVVQKDMTSALHDEGVIRLKMTGSDQRLTAGDFMPIAASLNLTTPIDLSVVKLAIDHLQATQGDVAVNLSAETMADSSFRGQLVQLLQGYPALCPRLSFEVPEYGVFKQFEAFRDLTRSLKALGCRVGIEYFGQRFAESDKLATLGIDYLKVHPSYVRGIADNVGNQEFLKGLCNVAHALGITVIALGVERLDDLPLLAQLGFDGATGPGVG